MMIVMVGNSYGQVIASNLHQFAAFNDEAWLIQLYDYTILTGA